MIALTELEDALGERDRARTQLMEAERLLAAVPELEVALDDAIGRVARMSAERDGIVAESIRAKAELERTKAELECAIADLRSECERQQEVMERVWRSSSWRITAALRAAKRLVRRPSGRLR